MAKMQPPRNKAAGPNTAIRDAAWYRETMYFHEARLSGWTYAHIADLASAHFGYYISGQKVSDRLKTHWREVVTETAEESRRVEVDRLDRYLAALDAAILTPPTKELEDGTVLVKRDEQLASINTALRIAERRAKLLGLDTPVKVEATIIERTEADQHIAELLAEMGAAE